MRVIYQRCRLVHADLSEYNILCVVTLPGSLDRLLTQALLDCSLHNSHLYIIDVSQSVEHDHPSSFDFLRMDIRNVSDFFRKRSAGQVRLLSARRTFEFITTERIGDAPRRVRGKGKSSGASGGADTETVDGEEEDGKDFEKEEWERVLREWIDSPENGDVEDDDDPATGSSSTPADASSGADLASLSIAPSSLSSSSKPHDRAAQDEAVFLSSYIPRTLSDVYDPERDVALVKEGRGGDLIYARDGGVGIAGVGADKIEEGDEDESEDEDGDEDGSGDEDGEGADPFNKKPRGHRHEDKEAKKVRLGSSRK